MGEGRILILLCMNYIPIMQYCKTTKSIPQNPFPCTERNFLLGEVEQVVGGIVDMRIDCSGMLSRMSRR